MSMQEDFIKEIAPHVQSWVNYYGYGVPSAIIAQACLESGYGKSDKAVNYHNYFGLKYKPGRCDCNDGYFTATSAEQLPDGSYITITTQWFSFPDINTGVQGYMQFVNIPRYAKIKEAKEPETYLSILKEGGYATSKNYVSNCMSIVNKYNLTQYDTEAPMYTNSPLVVYTDITDHNYGPRTHKIDTITIHHMAGNLSVETCGSLFHRKNGSSNYGIGTDGRIALYVPESNGAWTSSNKANDMRAITIEVANNTLAPYWTCSTEALCSLVLLVADICKRNGIPKLIWSDNKSDRINHRNGCNCTMHKDFASTACPGPFLSANMKNIIEVTNNLIGQPAPTSGYIINGVDYSPVFDPVYYDKVIAAPNSTQTLGDIFNHDYNLLWDHFCNFGMNELRQAKADFDPVYYKNTYADLREAYDDDNPMYYYHYCVCGKNEGRKCHA